MTRPKPHIAMLHYSAPPIVGGVEAIMAEHARLFLEAGYSVTLVVGRGGDAGLPEGVGVRLIPEIDSEHPANRALVEALDRGEVPEGFTDLRDFIAERLAETLARIDILVNHSGT